MMGRLNDPALIVGFELSMMVFDFMYFGLGFLRMGITDLVASQADLIAFIDAYWIWVAILPLTSFLAFQVNGIFVGPHAEKKYAMRCKLPLPVLPQQFC